MTAPFNAYRRSLRSIRFADSPSIVSFVAAGNDVTVTLDRPVGIRDPSGAGSSFMLYTDAESKVESPLTVVGVQPGSAPNEVIFTMSGSANLAGCGFNGPDSCLTSTPSNMGVIV